MGKRTKTQKTVQHEDSAAMSEEIANNPSNEEHPASAEEAEAASEQTGEMIEASEAAEADMESSERTSDDSEDDDELEASSEDEGEDESEAETKEKKKRGKRQVLFCCSGVLEEHENEVTKFRSFQEEIPVTMPADEDQKLDPAKGRAEVIDIFQAKHGYKPHDVRGPFYNYKGIGIVQRKRETLNQSIARDANFTAERGVAIHHFKDLDWKVLVNFTDRPDTVFVFYEGLVDPKQAPKDKANKLQKPAAKFLPIKALRDIKRTSTQS